MLANFKTYCPGPRSGGYTVTLSILQTTGPRVSLPFVDKKQIFLKFSFNSPDAFIQMGLQLAYFKVCGQWFISRYFVFILLGCMLSGQR